VAGGNGVFVAELVLARGPKGEQLRYIRARNWLRFDQLKPHQRREIAPPGEHGQRLGQSAHAAAAARTACA
jgi:hypothetical protein